MSYQKLIIIGAPRSGTNMLRDILCSFEGVATWPCDEINYIWRHGNVHYPSDEIPPHNATQPIATYIQEQFDWVIRRYKAHTVVEKTCANSLRVPFVDHVLPDAKYCFIRRNGLDAVGSALKRWKADLDIHYLARKARFVPLSDIPYYSSRYFKNRLYRFFSNEQRLAFWGPQLHNMESILKQHPLDEVCAIQWQTCVDKAYNTFKHMRTDRWLEISYEDFVTQPEDQLRKTLNFINVKATDEQIHDAVNNVRADSVGKGRAALDKDALKRLSNLVSSTLATHGYS